VPRSGAGCSHDTERGFISWQLGSIAGFGVVSVLGADLWALGFIIVSRMWSSASRLIGDVITTGYF